MDEKEEIRKGLENTYSVIQSNMEKSFKYMEDNPQEKDAIIKLWKEYIKRLFNDLQFYSVKYNNKEIIKTLTKAILFGR